MAKLPKAGAAYQCLYEQERSLSEVMTDLGLKRLSKKAEGELRYRLGIAIADWEEPYPPVEVDHIVRSLKFHAKNVDRLARFAAVAKGGMSCTEDIEVATRVAQALSQAPTFESLEAGFAFLEDFADRALLIASACRTAAESLQLAKGNDGRPPYHWHDEFTAVLLDICKQNGIKPTVRLDRVSGQAVGAYTGSPLLLKNYSCPECDRVHPRRS